MFLISRALELFSRPDLVTDGRTNFSSSSSGSDDDDDSVEQSHVTYDILELDNYFKKCRYEEHRESVAHCYDQFVRHSPLILYADYPHPFTPLHLRGLEYLMSEERAPSTLSVDFPCIYIERRLIGGQSVSRPVERATDTFLVNRLADYIYGYIIDIAFLRNKLDSRLMPLMAAMRQRYRTRRIESYTACTIEHRRSEDSQCCPQEWVVYTKKTSPFFADCLRQLDQNGAVAYDTNTTYLNITPVSFNLVSFLCGPFATDSQHTTTGGENTVVSIEAVGERQFVSGYDQWVVVPVFFIDLWNTMNPRRIVY